VFKKISPSAAHVEVAWWIPDTQNYLNVYGLRKIGICFILLMAEILAPVDMVNIPLFVGFYTSQVVQDFSTVCTLPPIIMEVKNVSLQ